MIRDSRFRLLAAGLALAIILCAMLAGCGGRDPATKAEADRARYTAEADSGLAATRAALGASMTPQVADIIDGSAAFARAAAGDLALPGPAWTPQRIAEAPAAYRKAGEAAERTAKGSQVWFWLKVGLSAAVPVLLAVAKNLPGVGAVMAPLVEGLWHVYAPKASKQEDEARATLAAHASNVVQIATAVLPPGDAQRVVGHLTPEVIAALQSLGVVIPAPVPLRPTTPA